MIYWRNYPGDSDAGFKSEFIPYNGIVLNSLLLIFVFPGRDVPQAERPAEGACEHSDGGDKENHEKVAQGGLQGEGRTTKNTFLFGKLLYIHEAPVLRYDLIPATPINVDKIAFFNLSDGLYTQPNCSPVTSMPLPQMQRATNFPPPL